MADGSIPAWERAGCAGGELGFSPLCQCINILDSESELPRNREIRSSTSENSVTAKFRFWGFSEVRPHVPWPALTAVTTPRTTPPGVVSDLYVDPNNANRMWATYRTVGGGRVYRSDDGGSAWTNLTAGLPELPINAIEVDPRNGNRVWVGADLGVYQSTDGGATWADFSNGLPNMYVGDLVYQPHARVLRAGTRNRGVWEIPVDGWMTQPVCGVQWTGSLVGNETRRWFTFNWSATWHVVWTVMPTTPRPGAPQVSWTVQVERASAEYVTYWITVRNLTPDPVNFEGRYCILSRY